MMTAAALAQSLRTGYASAVEQHLNDLMGLDRLTHPDERNNDE